MKHNRVQPDPQAFSKRPHGPNYRNRIGKMENENEDQDGVEQRSTVVRTWSMQNSAARQVMVNFMPSRQLPTNTVKLRRTKSEHLALLEEMRDPDHNDSVEQQANIIVRGMEQHQQLMEDNPEAEELRREALRDLPQGLTMKRNVRAKLSASVSLRSKRKPISFTKRMKYRVSFSIKKFHERIRNFIFSIELWYEAIRKVEGHFGSAVGSYFYFLRWLFVVNFIITVFIISFVVVPQILFNQSSEVDANATTHSSHVMFDFISGKGSFEDTILFYGHYHSGVINAAASYNMAYAYFFTMLVLYIFFFVVLCFRTAFSYRRNFIDTAGGWGHVYASKVFCGWDFGIATPHAAALNARSIYNEFKELLSEQNKKKEIVNFWAKAQEYLVNTVVTICVLGFIAGVQSGLYMVLALRVDTMDTLRTSEHWALIVSAFVTGLIAVCPIIFNFVVKLEYYTPRTALYVTLARTFLLDITTLIILLVFWSRSYVRNTEERTSESQCWETVLGQETYRLVLFDALFSLFFVPTIEFIRGFIFNMYPGGLIPEFNIAYNSLTLIYNQAVLWLGMLFCPLLAAVVTLKFFIIFYVKNAVVMYACQPARKIWRASQTQTVLYMIVNMSMFITLFAVGSLFIRSSSECGPFREYDFVYSVLTEGLLGLSYNRTLYNILVFATRPGVIAFLLLFLAVGVYYMRAKSLAQRSMVQILRQMLVLEAKDKDFLLSAIAKVSNGEWHYSPKINEKLEPNNSHTWKYLNNDNVRKPSNAGYHFEQRPTSSVLDNSRPRSYLGKDRPSSMYKERPTSSYNRSLSEPHKEDGDTDSSFSWQGSTNYLSDPQVMNVTVEGGKRKWL